MLLLILATLTLYSVFGASNEKWDSLFSPIVTGSGLGFKSAKGAKNGSSSKMSLMKFPPFVGLSAIEAVAAVALGPVCDGGKVGRGGGAAEEVVGEGRVVVMTGGAGRDGGCDLVTGGSISSMLSRISTLAFSFFFFFDGKENVLML